MTVAVLPRTVSNSHRSNAPRSGSARFYSRAGHSRQPGLPHLPSAAENKAPPTIVAYATAVTQLEAFLERTGTLRFLLSYTAAAEDAE